GPARVQRAAGSCEGGPAPPVKTLLSAGRKCPAGLTPVTGSREAAPERGGESAVAPGAPFSPALPRGHTTSRRGAVMISRVLSAELAEHAGQRVTIAGWVHRRRLLKSVSFLIVRDRAGLTQVVAGPGDLPAEESVVRVTGTVTASPQAPDGVELTEPEIDTLSRPSGP